MKNNLILALGFLILSTQNSIASQFEDFPFESLNCDQGQLHLSIQNEKISSKYSLNFIRFKLKNKKGEDQEYTLSALGNMLTRKCSFYFYSFNPEAELFEMRLNFKNKILEGVLALTKPKNMSKKISCLLTKEQIEILPKYCFPLKPKNVKVKQEPNRVPRKANPYQNDNTNRQGNDTGSSAEIR